MRKGTFPDNLCLLTLSLFLIVLLSLPVSAAASTIIDDWTTIAAPQAPALKSVIVDPLTTAFLILDIQQPMCNAEQRPRCAASVPKIADFLLNARVHSLSVVYSLTPTATPADIVSAVSPLPGEPFVRSSVDKFYNTDLENILKDKGIKTVIIAGTVAHGAVLHTATGASMRGFQVIVPVDGMSSVEPYAEQYTAWHMLNAPGTRARTTLTTFDRISFQ